MFLLTFTLHDVPNSDHLTIGLSIRVISATDSVLAAKVRVGDGGEGGVVHARLPGDLLHVVVPQLGLALHYQQQQQQHCPRRCYPRHVPNLTEKRQPKMFILFHLSL